MSWHVDVGNPTFPQPAGEKLAELTSQTIYGSNALPDIESHLVVRDEYLGTRSECTPGLHEPRDLLTAVQSSDIDYYGVTFDNNVPSDEYFPEVLQINIIEIETDKGEYANGYRSIRQTTLARRSWRCPGAARRERDPRTVEE